MPHWPRISGLRGRVVCLAAVALAPTVALAVVTAFQVADLSADAYQARVADAARARRDLIEDAAVSPARPLSELLSEPHLPDGAFAVVADAGGTILAQFPAAASVDLTYLPRWVLGMPEADSGAPVSGLWLDESETTCYSSRTFPLGWTLAVCAPSIKFEATWRHTLAIRLGLVVVTVTLALFVADVVGRRLVATLMRMVNLASAFATRTDQRASDVPHSSVAEFEALRQSLERAEGVLRRRSAAERMALQEARMGQEVLASVVNATLDLIHVKDLQGRFVLVNRSALQHHGVDDDEWKLLGRKAADLYSADVARRIEMLDREVLANGEPLSTEEVWIRPDGAERLYATTVSPWHEVSGKVSGVVYVARDVTDQRDQERHLRSVQSELLRASRLSAMGAMASGLAHELNQPLAAATNFMNAAARFLDRMGTDPPETSELIRGAVKDAASQLLRAGSIVRRLRDFIGRGEAELRAEDVCELIVEACDVARADGVFADVRLRVDVPGEVTEAMVDRTQIQQVLLNLLRNAAEAMAGRPDAEVVVSSRVRHDDDGLEIIVSDNGPGLAPEIVSRLFQPFASTKASGMGIGLAICRTIVEGHGGSLNVEANPNGGVAFRIGLAPLQPAEDEYA